jgi:hypothetical protein
MESALSVHFFALHEKRVRISIPFKFIIGVWIDVACEYDMDNLIRFLTEFDAHMTNKRMAP